MPTCRPSRAWSRTPSQVSSIVCLLGVLVGAPPSLARAQETPGGGGTSQEPAVEATDTHMFGVLPNYNTTNEQPGLHPMRWTGKMELAAKGTFDPFMFPIVAVIAAPQENYGGGWQGFGKQYAASYADTAIGNFMTTGVLPSVLHQDPRYYRRGRGGVWRRIGYSVSRTLVAFGDSGHQRANIAEVTGTLAAAGISNAYYPGARTMSSTISRWGMQMMWDTLTNQLKEFSPDIKKLLPGNHDSSNPTPSSHALSPDSAP